MQSKPGITHPWPADPDDDNNDWEGEDGWWDDDDWDDNDWDNDDWVDDSGVYVADDRRRFAWIVIAVFIAGLIVGLAVWWFQ